VTRRVTAATWHYAPSLGRLQARTSWNDAADVRLLDMKLSWNTIDHQHGDGNMFDFWRKGEWLTKELSAYGAGAALSEFKSTLAIQNDPAARVAATRPRCSRPAASSCSARTTATRSCACAARRPATC
jgi:hypothetical protein